MNIELIENVFIASGTTPPNSKILTLALLATQTSAIVSIVEIEVDTYTEFSPNNVENRAELVEMLSIVVV